MSSTFDEEEPLNLPPVPASAQVAGLVVFLIVCYIAGYIGQIATQPAIETWYAGLAKPAFTPPNSVFPIVWTILYGVMALAAWLVWRERNLKDGSLALTAFFAQLFLNVIWSWAFFGAESPVLGLVVIVALLIAIAATTLFFFRVNRLAGLLMLPYLAWVAFATVLNASIVALN